MIWLGQNLYNIVSEPPITINLVSVMKMCLKETSSNIHLSTRTFAAQNGLR